MGTIVYVGRVSGCLEENILEDLETEILEYETAGEFSTDIKKEFREEDEESIKVAKLKKLKQGGKMMEEFVQKFRRAARGSRYEGHLLIEEFTWGIHATIRRRLMEVE